MVEIRVAVADATRVHGLMGRLGRLFDRGLVRQSAKRSSRSFRVGSRSVVEVIDVVQSWLQADGLGSARLSVGDRSYTMVGPVDLPVTSGRAA
jgi:hypothetical protein